VSSKGKDIFQIVDKLNKDGYAKYLKNKRVALVGPGWHTKNTNQGDLIDSYDIVVRMNDGISLSERFSEDLGKRTDILYCSLGDRYFRSRLYFTGEKYKKIGKKSLARKSLMTAKNIDKFDKFLKWITVSHATKHPSNVRKLLNLTKNSKVSVNLVKKDIFKIPHNVIGKAMNTGPVTIYDLCSYEIKELYITGISFFDRKTTEVKNNKVFRSGYPRTVRTKKFGIGTIQKEIKFFTQLAKTDKRIICDEVLDKIVKNN
jgi:hypothetical protein